MAEELTQANKHAARNDRIIDEALASLDKELAEVAPKPKRHRRTPAQMAAAKAAGEFDPKGFKPHTPGAKLDGGKTPVMQGAIEYFPRALEAVAQVSGYGATKYAWKGWESVPDGITRYSNAMGRHILAIAKGHVHNSKDGNLLHAAQRAWNDLAALELLLRDMEKANG